MMTVMLTGSAGEGGGIANTEYPRAAAVQTVFMRTSGMLSHIKLNVILGLGLSVCSALTFH